MTTLGAAVTDATARLAAAGIDDARREAGYLVRHALGIAVPALEATRSLDEQERSRLETLVCRRATREPMAKITGAREFWSLPFRVTGATLDPRPDSECAVETALAHARGARRILDFGTGTGCLLLALLSELPDAHGIGVDSSTAALEVAAANAAALGLADRVRFVAADWGRGIAGSFDIIVANPPYIPSREIVRRSHGTSRGRRSTAVTTGSTPIARWRRIWFVCCSAMEPPCWKSACTKRIARLRFCMMPAWRFVRMLTILAAGCAVLWQRIVNGTSKKLLESSLQATRLRLPNRAALRSLYW